MAKKEQNTDKQLIVKMKRIGYDVVGKQVAEKEEFGVKMLTFEILEVTGSDAPFKVGDNIDVSTNELKYHFTYYK